MNAVLMSCGRARQFQQGQAIPIGLFFLFVCMALMYFMFNSGQAVGEKVRVTSAADLAAYSVGIQEARALNYDAYVNRAIVANEIAIAQMLSLQSWIHYFDKAVEAAPQVASYVGRYMVVPPSGDTADALVFAAALAGTDYLDAYTGGEALDYVVQGIDYASIGIVSAHNAAAVALSASQTVVHASLLTSIAQRNLANDVVRSIDPTMSAEVVPLTHGFDTFTKNYQKNGSAGDERGRLASVVMRSRDRFTRDRSWTLSGTSIPLVQRNVDLKKRAGTDLINYDEWKAMDTLEGHASTFGCGKIGLSWCGDIEQEMAWGGARAVADGAGGGSGGGGGGFGFGKGGSLGGGSPKAGYLGGAYAENDDAAKWGDMEMVTVTDNGAIFTGLPGTRDLANLATNAPVSTSISILVSKSAADVRTTRGSAATKPTGRLDLFNGVGADGRMASLARAEVFFDRPIARSDGSAEKPSLYNPYWTVRLVAPTTADRAFAAAFQGGAFLP